MDNASQLFEHIVIKVWREIMIHNSPSVEESRLLSLMNGLVALSGVDIALLLHLLQYFFHAAQGSLRMQIGIVRTGRIYNTSQHRRLRNIQFGASWSLRRILQ